jgi:glycosyltransferase involved in cell wall biosynthesis
LENGKDFAMGQALVSCIIPVYNGERYLREAICSILAQTYRPLEIIVADDGSTDGTAAVIAAYGNQVRYLSQANTGPAAARNLGLRAALGDSVAFLDADDLWHPEKLARQMTQLQKRPEIDLCFARYRNFWIPDLAEEERRFRNHPLSHAQAAWCIGTLLARRAAFEKFGYFNERAREFENMIWFLRAAAEGAVIEFLPDVLMDRRFHPDNITRTKKAEISNSFFSLLKQWRDFRRRRLGGLVIGNGNQRVCDDDSK